MVTDDCDAYYTRGRDTITAISSLKILQANQRCEPCMSFDSIDTRGVDVMYLVGQVKLNFRRLKQDQHVQD